MCNFVVESSQGIRYEGMTTLSRKLDPSPIESRYLAAFFIVSEIIDPFPKKLFLFLALNSKRFEKMSRFAARDGYIFAVDILVDS